MTMRCGRVVKFGGGGREKLRSDDNEASRKEAGR